MQKKPLFLFVGQTATGKSTIARQIADIFGFSQVKSCTTRPPRNDKERNGISDHIFLTESEFDQIPEQDIVAYTKIGGYRYCTTSDVLRSNQIYVIDPNGIKFLREHPISSEFDIYEIFIDVDEEEAKKRYESRGGADYNVRRAKEDEQFDRYRAEKSYDLLVINNDLQESVDMVSDFIRNCYSTAE